MENIKIFIIVIFCALLLNYFHLGIDNSNAAVYTQASIYDSVVILPLNKNYDFVSTSPTTALVKAYPMEISQELPKKKTYSKIQLECLARNLYFEARGEGEEGLEAVAWTTMNRVHSNKFPNSICAVVYQGKRNSKGVVYRCEFSWTCDGTIKKIRNISEWKLAKRVAKEIAEGYDPSLDTTKGSLFYHADYILHKRPFKKMKVIKTVQIGQHIFYKKG